MFPTAADRFTAQGYDTTFGVNVIGHFLLVRLLYPILSASGSKSDPSRIIWLSSMAHHEPRAITYEAFRDGPVNRKADPFHLYGQSKLAEAMLSTCHARRCIEENVISIAVDPGCIRSDIYRSSPWHLKFFVRHCAYLSSAVRRTDDQFRIGCIGTP